VYKIASKMSKDDYRRADAAVHAEWRLSASTRRSVPHRATEASIAALTKLCGYEPTVALGLRRAGSSCAAPRRW
jgi:hypothetical protein